MAVAAYAVSAYRFFLKEYGQVDMRRPRAVSNGLFIAVAVSAAAVFALVTATGPGAVETVGGSPPSGRVAGPASPHGARDGVLAARVAKPQRIVSLNMCLDQLLIELVPKRRMAAVSYLAKDKTLTPGTGRFDGIPVVKGEAEEVLHYDPDLILVGEYTTPATVALLKRLGRNVAVVPLASDFQTMRDTIRDLASLVGEETRGAEIVAAFDARLAAIRDARGPRPTALAYQVNSLVSGRHSLLDAAIEAAGFRNLARSLPLGPTGRLPLEKLIGNPPDLVILANGPDDFRTVLADNLRHPALTQLLAERPHAHLPMPLWMCATPDIADAVETLARAHPHRQTAGHDGDGATTSNLAGLRALPSMRSADARP